MRRTILAAPLTLLLGFCASTGPGHSEAPNGAQGAQTELPTRPEVEQAMQALQSEIQRCSTRAGEANVTVVFESYGVVKDAQVQGQGYDADALLCVKGNVLRAKLRPFLAPQYVVQWTYRLGEGG